MKNNKICFNKSLGIIVLVVLVIGLFVAFTTKLTQKSTSTNTRAEVPKKSVVASPLKINGGDPAEEGEFPFYALLDIKIEGVRYRCGGALISSEWVLTAAHCVKDYETNGIDVIIGLNHINTEMRALHYSHVDNVIPHENFDKLMEIKEDFDIALLHLQYSAIGIPTLSLYDIKNGRYLEEIVSGLKQPQNQAIVMGFADMKDIKKTVQTIGYGNAILLYHDKFFSYDQTGSWAGINDGDSGSPVISTYENTTYLIGVASMGNFLYSNIYTSTSYYFPWIKKKTGIAAGSGTYRPGMKIEQRPLRTLICGQQKNSEACNMIYGAFGMKEIICTWDRDTNKCKPNES